jgi:hypothetical protein
MTQNEIKGSAIILETRRESQSLKPVSWKLQSNILGTSSMVVLPDNYGGSVSSTLRFNRFTKCDRLEFHQGGPGGRTLIDRNLFFSCPRIELFSEVANPEMDFVVISNSFETQGALFTVRQSGEVFYWKNFYDSAVTFVD